MMLKDVEIFATGKWPGSGAVDKTFTTTDLQDIVSSFNTLKLAGRVPIKIGHDGRAPVKGDGAPALGWVEAVRRDGDKLLADINVNSDKLAAAIKDGSFKFVSVELLRNVQAHTGRIAWVLDAVALLGATPPAVGILKSLQESMQPSQMSARPALTFESRIEFSRGNPDETVEQVRAEYEVKLNRAKVDGVIEVAIASAQVASAARESFRLMFKDEGYTLENWQMFARTQPKPQLRPVRMSRDGTSTDDGTSGNNLSAADQLTKLCEAEVDRERVKFGRVVQIIDVASRVHRRHPELTARWHEEMQDR